MGNNGAEESVRNQNSASRSWAKATPAWREARRTPAQCAWRAACCITLFFAVSAGPVAAANEKAKVFTIANYPVEARAKDAVTAKEHALADGQQAALKSLLRRLVPVTYYPKLRSLAVPKASDYLEGLSVRSERNSTVEYIASLDFAFQPKAVRDLLNRERLPFVDEQAREVLLVVAYNGGGQGAVSPAEGARLWVNAWTGLDIVNGLTPLKVDTLRKEVHPDTIRSLLAGDASAIRVVRGEHKRDDLLVAVAESDGKSWNVALVGDDASGPINYRKSYRIHSGDNAYASELAAVVSYGIIEGRWKQARLPAALQAAGISSSGAEPGGRSGPSDGAIEMVRMFVEYSSMAQWQGLRRQLMSTPGVEAMEVGSLSASGASVSLLYPGGGDGLADALTGQGLTLERLGGTWVLRFN